MDRPKLALKKKNTVFGSAISEALEKGKSSSSYLSVPITQPTQEPSAASSFVDELLKKATKDEELRKEKLAKRRAKTNQARNQRQKLTEVESLRQQVSALTKTNNELKKKASEFLLSSSSPEQQKRISNLLAKALAEIKKMKSRNITLEKENKTLREVLMKSYEKSLNLTGENAFYGGQYSDPET